MKTLKQCLLACSLSVLLAACSSSDNNGVLDDNNNPANDITSDVTRNIVDTAASEPSFSTLHTALEATGLNTVLADESRQFTVFAPSDDAFAKLGQDTINALLNDTDTLTDILLYHVIADAAIDAQTAISLAGSNVTMANEDTVALSLDGMRLFVNESEVINTDISTSNGIIHVIDTVLIPPADTGAPDPTDQPLPNLVETALNAGDFTILTAALEATGLNSVLADSAREFTVFAPNDEAFRALGEEAINALLAEPDTLRDILLYHVLADARVDAATAISLAGSTTTTANGDDIALSLDEGKLFVNRSEVIATDIVASNGIIHVLDSVLQPPADNDPQPLGSIIETASAAGSFNSLLAALQATGLDAVLADTDATFTVFAPTDEAIAKLGQDTIDALLADPQTLSDILLYHVIAGQAVDSTTAISLSGSSVESANGDSLAISLDGERLLINQSEVIAADIQASNGIIHAIDTVLIPPSPAPQETGTLLDVARNAGNFTILVAALEATGLDDAIGHPDDLYTVFAPTDEAFAALGQDTIDALLADPSSLRDILLYHVIAGTEVNATTAGSLLGVSIEMGNGDRASLSERGGSLFINDSRVIATDIRGVNGIIHVIDKVLIPPAS